MAILKIPPLVNKLTCSFHANKNVGCIVKNINFACKFHLVRKYSASCGSRSKTELTLFRLMGPDDANALGKVHGGTILKLIEEAGAIVATKFCNSVKTNKYPEKYAISTFARIEKMDFNSPMHIGEVAEVIARVTYTAFHSLEVTVDVFAENILKGNRRKTNDAKMWYVPVNIDNVQEVLPVPKLEMTEDEIARGKAAYENQRQQRACTLLHVDSHSQDMEPFTVSHSRTVMTFIVSPSNAFSHGYCKGGVLLKLMDECAGITAAKHSKSPVVTASLDATNFLAKSKIGSVLNLNGVLTYTSAKSMEVEVLVDSAPVFEGSGSVQRAAEAFFTFVSLDKNGKPQEVPPLKIRNAQEQSRYENGQQRYLHRKHQRSS